MIRITFKTVKNSFFLISIFVIFLLSCQRNGMITKASDQKQLFSLVTYDKSYGCIEKNLSSIDSNVGLVICNKDTFHYDIGRFSDPGPVSLLDKFKTTFQHYHYSDFFRRIGMDEKVFKTLRKDAFIDSVFLKSEFNRALLFDCGPCNAVAKIIFKGTTFYYPFTSSKTIIDNYSNYTFYHRHEENLDYKWYKSKNNKESFGLFIDYKNPEDKVKNVSITNLKSKDAMKSFQWLRSIRIKDNTNKK